MVSFQPQPAANSRTSLLQRHLSALGPNQPPSQPTNTHLMLTCLRRDQKVPHWDSTTMEPLQQNSDEQHSGLSHVGHLRPSSDASHAEKAAAVGDKQTGCAGKNDVMSDRGIALARSERSSFRRAPGILAPAEPSLVQLIALCDEPLIMEADQRLIGPLLDGLLCR